MPFSRRALIASIGATLAVPKLAFASGAGARVIVRGSDGVVAVDPRTGDTGAWDGPLPATPAAGRATQPVPPVIATPVTEGSVGYWMATPGEDGFIFRLDTGASATWWWRRPGGRAMALDLPADLEPAFPSGTSARWFHGATVDSSHLGSGTLRLLAVDIESGERVLDHELDRRLELAATKVSDDGAVVAHVQSSTTGVAVWAADLRDGARQIDAVVEGEAGLAAASAIDLAVAADGDAALVAAGLAWSWRGAPEPAVTILWSAAPDVVSVHTVPGKLFGIAPES